MSAASRPWVLCLVVCCGCLPDLQVPQGAQITCSAQSPCLDGFVCRLPAGRCAPATSDSTAPTLSGPPPFPSIGKAGTQFTVAFDVSEQLLRAPLVTARLRGRSEALVRDNAASTGDHHVYRYQTRGDEPEGVVEVSADLIDPDFNAVEGAPLGSFVLDFTGPRIATASVSHLAGDDNPLGSVTQARAGTAIVVTVVADEALAAPDAGTPPRLTATGATGSTLDFVLTAQTPTTATFVAKVKATDPDGVFTPAVSWSDVAGNTSTGIPFADPPIEVKTSVPVLTVDQPRVVFLRSPWGSGTPEVLDGGLVVPAGPYFALSPADALNGATASPESTFALVGRPIVQLRVWADPDAGFLLGQTRPGDGGWPRLRLANVDRPQIFVTGLDRAGNESATVAIENSEWVATPIPPAFGQPEHRLQFSPQAESTLDAVPPAWSAPTSGAILARAELAWHSSAFSSNRPRARSGHAMAYDSARARVVLFGGADNLNRQDTWEWDGAVWTDKTPTGGGPSARVGHAMVYDSARGRVVLVGGYDGAFLQDLWEWDGTRWLNQTPAGPRPSARYGHAIAYDGARGRVVLFGGSQGPGVALKNDLWEWDGATWVDRTPAAGPAPSARELAGLAYDSARGRLVMFGGSDGANLQDVWEWDGATWLARTPIGPKPTARKNHALAYDAARRRVVLFGGFDGTRRQDLWEWDGTTWLDQTPTGPGPIGRSSHRIAYDLARGQLILFGGYDGSADLQDTWVWDGTAWREHLGSVARPSARGFSAMAYDSARGRVVLFGGYEHPLFTSGSPTGDVWEWDGSSWVNKSPVDGGAAPVARDSHAMAYDSARGRVVVFGGKSATAVLHDVWEWDGTSWVDKTPAPDAGPRARQFHAMAFDSVRNKVVVFAGQDGAAAALQDTWEWDGATWVEKTPAGPRPPARFFHSAAFDGQRGKLVVFGGASTATATFLRDVWEWDGTGWLNKTPSGALPPGAPTSAMTFDSARGRVMLFAGSEGPALADLWEWDGAQWADKTPAGLRPRPRNVVAVAYDGQRKRSVLFGGRDEGGGYLDDTWELEANPARQPAIQFTVSAAGAGIPASSITGLRVRAQCGGVAAPFGPLGTGSVLHGWATGGPAPIAPGGWRALAAHRTGLDAGDPRLDWTASGPTEARSLFVERDGRLAFQCRPDGGSGLTAAEASVALDSIEARLRYRLP